MSTDDDMFLNMFDIPGRSYTIGELLEKGYCPLCTYYWHAMGKHVNDSNFKHGIARWGGFCSFTCQSLAKEGKPYHPLS